MLSLNILFGFLLVEVNSSFLPAAVMDGIHHKIQGSGSYEFVFHSNNKELEIEMIQELQEEVTEILEERQKRWSSQKRDHIKKFRIENDKLFEVLRSEISNCTTISKKILDNLGVNSK